MTIATPPSALATIDQDILQFLDHALPVVLIIKLSAAWYYPSFVPSDSAPAIALINALFLVFCFYGTMRLLFTQPAALVLAEPAYLALLLLATASLATSVSPSNSLGLLRTASLFFGACLFLRYRFKPRHLLLIFAATMSILLIASIMAALVTPFGTMGGFDAGRWRGVFNHKNTLGENAAITLIVGAGLWATGKPRNMLAILTVTTSLICLSMAGSATALAVVIVALALAGTAQILVWARIEKSQGLWLWLILVIAALALGLAFIAAFAQVLGRDLTFTGRTEIWKQFLHFADQRPWTGWGWATISTSDAMLPLIRQTLGLPHIQTPHNGYLSTLVELGRPGLAIFVVWLLITALTSAHAAIHERQGMAVVRLALILGLMVHCLFESTSGTLPSLWLLLLLSTNRRLTVRW